MRGLSPSAVGSHCPLRVADVAIWYGERGGGITTYLDAKTQFARTTDAFEHHLVTPGERDERDGNRHRVRARMTTANGYRIPLRTSSLSHALRDAEPDVVLVHDRFWSLVAAGPVAADMRTCVVAVHHASAALEAAALPGPGGAYGKLFRHWERRAYGRVDAVMSAIPETEAGDRPVLPLRFGLDPAFRPKDGVQRGDHVLYAGRLAREKGIDVLLAAAARSREPWPIEIAGVGVARAWVDSLVRKHGLQRRIRFLDYIGDRGELAQAFASAGCVVVPGAYETFGLVILEAAASGGAVVAARNAPAARTAEALVKTFTPGDPDDLLRAIELARSSRPDAGAATALADRFTWEEAFRAELADLERLVR
jgi:glycosyltransferase involved in cell wall biosynthesis